MCEVKRYKAMVNTPDSVIVADVYLSEDFDRVQAENVALQARLTAQDQRVDELEGLLRTSLLAMSRIYRAGRDFIVGTGSDCDSVELMMENDPSAREIRAALNPTAEAAKS